MMRSFLIAAVLYVAVSAAPSCGKLKCDHDNCLRAFIRHEAEGESLCSAYTNGAQIPSVFESACDGSPARISSACACMHRPTVTITVPASSAPSQASAMSTTTSLSMAFSGSSDFSITRKKTKTKALHTSYANMTATILSSTGPTSIANSTHITSSEHHKHTHHTHHIHSISKHHSHTHASEHHTKSQHTHTSETTVISVTTTTSQHVTSDVPTSSTATVGSETITSSGVPTSSKVTTSSEGTTSSKVTTSSKITISSAVTTNYETTTSTTVSIATSSKSTASPTPAPSACICTDYAQVAPAVATCTSIRLQDIQVPSGSTLDLSEIKAGTVVTFAGTTIFDQTSSDSFQPILLGGSGVTITAEAGAIIDGNGQMYWDGLGGNGGTQKPNHFIAATKLTSNSVIENLHIRNYPNRCFAITGCSDLTIRNIVLDNSVGNLPNKLSAGQPAAHNTDGFGISTSTNLLITDSSVTNQDDCVAITSGDHITVRNMQCFGSHGLSIGSIGGKADNTVTNVLFTDSTLTGAANGARIKSNYGTTGLVSNVTFANLVLDAVTDYGIIVQQDYTNAGPTGVASNGVHIKDVVFRNITGSVAGQSATAYYVLCGQGSCSNMAFEDVNVSGGGAKSSCNFPAGGCPSS